MNETTKKAGVHLYIFIYYPFPSLPFREYFCIITHKFQLWGLARHKLLIGETLDTPSLSGVLMYWCIDVLMWPNASVPPQNDQWELKSNITVRRWHTRQALLTNTVPRKQHRGILRLKVRESGTVCRCWNGYPISMNHPFRVRTPEPEEMGIYSTLPIPGRCLRNKPGVDSGNCPLMSSCWRDSQSRSRRPRPWGDWWGGNNYDE